MYLNVDRLDSIFSPQDFNRINPPNLSEIDQLSDDKTQSSCLFLNINVLSLFVENENKKKKN